MRTKRSDDIVHAPRCTLALHSYFNFHFKWRNAYSCDVLNTKYEQFHVIRRCAFVCRRFALLYLRVFPLSSQDESSSFTWLCVRHTRSPAYRAELVTGTQHACIHRFRNAVEFNSQQHKLRSRTKNAREIKITK